MEKIPDIIHESWHEHLQFLFDNQKMKMIKDEILPNCKFFPEKDNIFRVFRKPLQEIKVVILGQDPYFKGEGIGYSFAVEAKTQTPPSLRIIRQEVINNGVERDKVVNIENSEWKTLKHWRNQGVFLLNCALTVEAYGQASHIGIWEFFSREVVNIISVYAKPVWLLWGARAKGYKYYINPPKIIITSPDINEVPTNITRQHNIVLEANHPAAETHPNSPYRFSGCNHFNLCNKVLKLRGQNIINW